MKPTVKGLTLTTLLVCSIITLFFLKPGKLYSQSLTVGDPILQYLRLHEAEDGSTPLPSLMLQPVSTDDYFQKLNLSSVHPWQGHLFFDRIQIEEVTETIVHPTDPQLHQVKAKETLYSISNRYGVTVENLRSWNDLEGNTIDIGQMLTYYPEGVRYDTLRTTSVSEEYIYPSQVDIGKNKSLQFYDPEVTTTYNNNYPIGQNDGALWQGKGVNSQTTLGMRLKHPHFEISLRPEFIYSQNDTFVLSQWSPPQGISEYGYEFTLIDYPQRFGNESISKIEPGQSWIRGQYNEFAAGVSTANIWLGPAVYNPILLGNNAPGFFHAFIGTYKPFETKIGNFEGKLFWGRLNESDYFDEDESNNLRMINGLSLIYSPGFVEGLHFGLSRIFVKPVNDDELSFGDYFMALGRLQHAPISEIDRLQMVSLNTRWKVPGYGFEIYAEWVRNSPAKSFRDMLIQPEYSRAYTMGFLKRFTLAPKHWLSLNFEMTQIERPRSVEFRFSQPFYRSNAVIQGYTHKGQILGAGIGPGSNSQKVQVSYYWPYGMFGLSFNRIVHDVTRLYENKEVIGERPSFIFNPRELSEIELRGGFYSIFFLSKYADLQFNLTRSYFQHFEHRSFGDMEAVFNTNIQFTLRYHLNHLWN